jgi:hypothetical protein
MHLPRITSPFQEAHKGNVTANDTKDYKENVWLEKKIFSYPRRELLVKSVPSAMPIFYMIVFKVPKWGFKHIDRFRRSFLWKEKYPKNLKGSLSGELADLFEA